MANTPSVNPELSVLLVYEDLEMGLLAKRVFDVIAEVSREEVKAHLSVWRFDLLDSPDLEGEMFNHSAQADIIILAPRNAGDLPTSVKRWLEILPENREAPGGALVGVFPTQADVCSKPSPAVELTLRAAERAKMDFFVRPGKPGFLHAPAFAGERPRMKAVCPEV